MQEKRKNIDKKSDQEKNKHIKTRDEINVIIGYLGLKKLYEYMEIELIATMKENLFSNIDEKIEKGIFNFNDWKNEHLQKLPLYINKNKKIIQKFTTGINEQVAIKIQEEVKQGSINAINQYNKNFSKKLNVNTLINKKDFFKPNNRKASALIKMVNDDLNGANRGALTMINSQYRQVIAKAVYFNAQGIYTEKQAIDMATKEFLSRGINCIEYKDGRRVNIASYSQMAVRTASLRAQLMGEGDFRKSIGRTLVKSTTHGGACPICQKWEGKVFIDDVYSGGTKEDGNYMLLSEAMKQGFLHPSCCHGLTTYFPELKDLESDTNETQQKDLEDIKSRLSTMGSYEKKYNRLSIGSIDEENIKIYENKKRLWQRAKNQLLKKLNDTNKKGRNENESKSKN